MVRALWSTFADQCFDVAFGPEEYALASAEELKEDFLGWIKKYDMGCAHDLWYGQEEFETYVLTQCQDFIRKWRSNVAKEFLADYEDEYRQKTRKLTQSIEQDPQNVTHYKDRATAYETIKEYRLAIQDYDMVIELEPSDNSYYLRGKAYRTLGEYDKAIDDFTKAIGLDTADTRPYCERGDLYLEELKDYRRAIRDYENPIALNPDDALTYIGRGDAYGELGESHSAIRDFDRAIVLIPNWSAAYSNRAHAYSGLGKHKKALKDFDEAINLGTKDAGAYFWRGTLYGRDLKNYTEALKDYDRAIELNPNHAEAYYNRGTVCERLGNHEQAITDTKIAARLGLEGARDYLKEKGIGW